MVDTNVLNHPVINEFYEALKYRFQLTSRELEVLKLITLLGRSNRELGDILVLSEKTVKNHVASIHKKMGVNSSRELSAVIFRDSLIPLVKSVFMMTGNAPDDVSERNVG